MKKEINLQLDAHINLLQEVAFKAMNGIKAKDIIQLRNIRMKDAYEYYNRLKLKYVTFLGLLGLEYKVNPEIEGVVFGYIDNLIQQLPADGMDPDDQFNISQS